MKVGDLVRDVDWTGTCTNQCGIIVDVDEYEGMFKVMWSDTGKEWLTQMYLEVISESR